MEHAVKLLNETEGSYLVGGYGVVWGGRDLRGEWFDQESDLWLDRVNGDPLLMFDHGFDAAIGRSVLGHVVTKTIDDVGLWIEGQIDKANEYAEMVMELVKKGVLGLSTGSVSHLAEIKSTGYVASWPIFEVSLTATPCEPRTVGVDDLTKIADANPSVKAYIDAVKALPVDGGDTGHPVGTYEDLIGSLSKLLRQRFITDPYDDTWVYVVDTYADRCVACVCEYGEAPVYYDVPYALGPDQKPVLGEPVQVERVYQPIESPPADTAATAVLSVYVVRFATTLAERVSALHQGRVKEGRVLSTANRERLKASRDALAGIMDTYDTLLTETEPKASAAVGATNADVEVQAAYARILAIASGLELAS